MLTALVVAVLLSGVTPVELPPTEDPADWEAALAMGGLVAGQAVGGAWVRVEAADDCWTLEVMDRGGALHEVRVRAPASEQEREDIVWLAVSLLHPAGVEGASPAASPVVSPMPARSPEPSLPSSPSPEPSPSPEELTEEPEPQLVALEPPPPRPPAERAPESEVEAAPEPEVEAGSEPEVEAAGEPEVEAAEEPEVEAAEEPIFVPTPEPEGPVFVPEGDRPPEPVVARADASPAVAPWGAERPRWFTTVGLGTDAVIGGTPAESFHLDLGFDVEGFFRLGVSGAVTSPSVLLWHEGATFMYGGDFFPLVAWLSPTPSKRILWLGAGVGMRIYRYVEPGEDSGSLASEIEDFLDEMLEGSGAEGSSVSFGSASGPGTDVGFALRLEIQGAVRLSEWAALAPWFQLQLVALDPDDQPPGRPDVLFPLTFRGGICFVMMRHVGRGLPATPRSR